MLHKVVLGKSVLFWVIVLAIILVCLALAVLIVVLVRRRRARRAAQGLGAAATPAPALDLRAVQREFEARLPYDHRRALPLFTPFVVLGDAGAGKSSLIDRYTDWRGQAAQFHPSNTDDPQLQIYQGAGAVVYELAPVLLRDPSRRVRDALLKLWRPLRRGKAPRAVVVLNASALASVQLDDLVKHAQAIRGKLNALTTATGRPVPAVIVLTHLDQVEGFLELAAVVHELGRPLTVDFAGGVIPPAATWLEPLEAYLPAVLATRPAPAYLKAARFLGAVGDLTARVETFARTLTAADPLAPAPRVTGLALTSAREPTGGPYNPFAVTITALEARAFHPQRRHLLAAAAGAALLTAWLLAGYVHGRNAIARTLHKLDTYLKEPQNPFARKELFDHLHAERHTLAHHLLPGFFASDPDFIDASVRRRFVDGLRQQVLLPKLTEYERSREGLRAVYLLSLLYASKDNHLGTYVRDHSSEWEDALKLPRTVVADYVAYNGALARIPLPFDDRGFGERFNVAVSGDLPSAPYLLDQLEKVPRITVLTKAQLLLLKQTSDGLAGDVMSVERTGKFSTVCKLLNRETGMSYGATWLDRVPRLPEVDRAGLGEMAALLKASELRTPDPQKLTLDQLVAQLEQLGAQKPGPARDLRLRAGDRTVLLSTADWERLLIRSRASLLLREFTEAKQGDFRATFFPQNLHYEAVDLSAGGDGGGVILTRARVDGIFTVKAYDERVQSALKKLPAVLKTLSISDDEKAAFTEFVTAEVEDYATRYQSSWRAFYRGYGYHVESASSLSYLLIQLQSPTSPLRRMLSEMARNTSLTLVDGNALFEPFGPVASTFGFLKALVPKVGGPMPALDKYVGLLGQLQGELDGQGATPADADGLAARLPPLGRVALAIFREQDDSYVAQVEKWLASVNVRADEREPFMGPVSRAYLLGLRDVERVAAESWSALRQSHIAPLGSAYPFRADAETTATPAVIEAALKPKGEFWTAFQAQLGPLCAKQQPAGWDRRRSRHRPVSLPADLLPTVRRLSELSERLFDAKGAPRPLTVPVRPQLLPPQRAGNSVAVAQYLQVGDTTVFGFNQRPDWSEVKLEWWKATTASVGAAFAPEGVGERTYRTVSVPENEWSLLRLLQRAPQVDVREHSYRWPIGAPGDGTPVQVGFQLRSDPLETLRVGP